MKRTGLHMEHTEKRNGTPENGTIYMLQIFLPIMSGPTAFKQPWTSDGHFVISPHWKNPFNLYNAIKTFFEKTLKINKTDTSTVLSLTNMKEISNDERCEIRVDASKLFSLACQASLVGRRSTIHVLGNPSVLSPDQTVLEKIMDQIQFLEQLCRERQKKQKNGRPVQCVYLFGSASNQSLHESLNEVQYIAECMRAKTSIEKIIKKMHIYCQLFAQAARTRSAPLGLLPKELHTKIIGEVFGCFSKDEIQNNLIDYACRPAQPKS